MRLPSWTVALRGSAQSRKIYFMRNQYTLLSTDFGDCVMLELAHRTYKDLGLVPMFDSGSQAYADVRIRISGLCRCRSTDPVPTCTVFRKAVGPPPLKPHVSLKVYEDLKLTEHYRVSGFCRCLNKDLGRMPMLTS